MSIDVADAMAAELADEPAAIAGAWCRYACGECRLDSDPLVPASTWNRRWNWRGREARPSSRASPGRRSRRSTSGRMNSSRRSAVIAALLSLWLRAGLQSPFWTGMRSVADLLMRAGETVTAIRLLGAVMAPGAGHDVFGDDAERLESMCSELEGRAGRVVFEVEFNAGAELDEAAAAHEATTAFDRFADPAALSAAVTSGDRSASIPRTILATVSWVNASLAGWKPPARTSR